MRHSSIDLTMNVYTDPKLLDVSGAMDVLPDLPMGDGNTTEKQTATGTDNRTLVPVLVPDADKRSISASISDMSPSRHHARSDESPKRVSACGDKRKTPLPSTDNGGHQVGVTGFEPTTSSPRTKRSTKLSYTPLSRQQSTA
jgi:hypothetical protein